MPSPFPGMDPYLERTSIWTEVHFWLIGAIADELRPQVRPHYRVAVERRVYQVPPDELLLVGTPDASGVVTAAPSAALRPGAGAVATLLRGVEVVLPAPETVHERYLEIRDPKTGEVITAIEVLSPTNKQPGTGRDEYLRKRNSILASLTNLVEIDLLRSGPRLPAGRAPAEYDYGVLISRGSERGRAVLYPLELRAPLPSAPIPLRPGEQDVRLDLGRALSDAYERSDLELVLDYSLPPEPSLRPDDAAWADALLRESGRR